jgi:hypothetical protein
MVRCSFDEMLAVANIPTDITERNMEFHFPGSTVLKLFHVSIGVLTLPEGHEDMYVTLGSVHLPEPHWTIDKIYNSLVAIYTQPCFMVEMDAPDDPMLCGAARCVDPNSAN